MTITIKPCQWSVSDHRHKWTPLLELIPEFDLMFPSPILFRDYQDVQVASTNTATPQVWAIFTALRAFHTRLFWTMSVLESRAHVVELMSELMRRSVLHHSFTHWYTLRRLDSKHLITASPSILHRTLSTDVLYMVFYQSTFLLLLLLRLRIRHSHFSFHLDWSECRPPIPGCKVHASMLTGY